MRILMLGWEFPPYVSGGLGTACYGLTRALARQGHQVTFIIPKPIESNEHDHVRLLSPASLGKPIPAFSAAGGGSVLGGEPIASKDHRASDPGQEFSTPMGGRLQILSAPAGFSSPYHGFAPTPPTEAQKELLELLTLASSGDEVASKRLRELGFEAGSPGHDAAVAASEIDAGGMGDYGRDLFGDSQRYARICMHLSRSVEFDVIHAHDWLTYPAGVAIRAVSGKPLVCHIHATEFDRSGEHVNQQVYDIERMGMHACDKLVAVSMLTRSICMRRYGVPESKIEVVYNGVESDGPQPEPGVGIRSKDKIVLFLGRITMQKGPEYFIRAAKRVLEKVEDVKFVVAGSGDMAMRMIDDAAQLGIGSKVLFTGFLRGRDVARVFRMADCYVMPSVSEPFGIAPLEAMSQDTPVIISKQSGVAEVLTHALKVDFWDIDEMANKIVAVLKYPPLSKTLRQHGAFEVRRLTWDGAAEKCIKAYTRAGAHAG